ncbi:hypothetical protein [Fodinicola acaciae]|uniref:hypothetical protein n=1 Tax=Fodinicola acaciae TaxID=2681555 RepID=UPI0013D64C5C|nr:hypothetical protein [Fodinicola acaciae]
MRILRSVAVRAAAVVAVAACGLAVAMPASAATGTLTIKQHGVVLFQKTNPAADCYELGKDFPQGDIDTYNNTDATVYLYGNPNCAGDPDTNVNPGQSLLGYPGFYSLRVLS